MNGSFRERVRMFAPLRGGLATAPVVLLFAIGMLGLGAGCSDDEDDDGATGPGAFLGTHVIGQGVPGADPLLTKAYLDVSQADLRIAATRLDWGETEPQLGNYDWLELDTHLNQARLRDAELSVAVLLIENRTRGGLPVDLAGQWLDSANLRIRFARFCRDLVDRGRGQIRYVWIGREVDVYLSENRDEIDDFYTLVSVCADSVARLDPDVGVGPILAATEAELGGFTDIGGALSDAGNALGLTVYGWNLDYVQTEGPEGTMARIRSAVDRLPSGNVIVTETAYPGEGIEPEEQERFAALLTAYLDMPPPQLRGVIWHALYDYSTAEAVEVAGRIYGVGSDLAEAYAAQLRSNGLKQVDGSTTSTWLRILDWQDNRPVSRTVLSP